MQGHMDYRHQAHICETYNEQHEEGNCRIVLIEERIQDDQREVNAQSQFKDRQDAGLPQVFLRYPAVFFAFDMVFRRSFERRFDSKQRFHDSFGITDRESDSKRHQEGEIL